MVMWLSDVGPALAASCWGSREINRVSWAGASDGWRPQSLSAPHATSVDPAPDDAHSNAHETSWIALYCPHAHRKSAKCEVEVFGMVFLYPRRR